MTKWNLHIRKTLDGSSWLKYQEEKTGFIYAGLEIGASL